MIDARGTGMHFRAVSKPKTSKATDPKSRQQRAARAVANHPRAAQILGSVDFRDPTPSERQTAASLRERARRVRSRHAAAA